MTADYQQNKENKLELINQLVAKGKSSTSVLCEMIRTEPDAEVRLVAIRALGKLLALDDDIV